MVEIKSSNYRPLETCLCNGRRVFKGIPGMMTAYTLKYWDTASGTIYCIHFRGGKVGVNYIGPLSGCQARYKMLNSNKRARRRLKASMILDRRIVDSQCENCERLAVVE